MTVADKGRQGRYRCDSRRRPRRLRWVCRQRARRRTGFTATSNGYLGTSDGWTDLAADGTLDWRHPQAGPGNVVQTGQLTIDGLARQRATLALGFGAHRDEALATARSTLRQGFSPTAKSYADGWRNYLQGLRSPAAVRGDRRLYTASLMVLAATEDKRHPGAVIASPSMPWAFGFDRTVAEEFGSYALVWPRDLYQVASAMLAAGDRAGADRYLTIADRWQSTVDKWTATSTGPLSDGPYYLRLTKDGQPDRGTTYSLGDNNPGQIDQRAVVDPSFLELVRLGVKPATDPVIRNTLAVIDKHLATTTPAGRFWHRFTSDGYGERADGGPWNVEPTPHRTYGRLWPILAGERGEYDLLAGDRRSATRALTAIAATAGSARMLPEQVWDDRSPAPDRARPGTGTTSATPLAWTHAQYIRLAWSIDAGRPVEQPTVVACRYTTC